MAMVRDLVRDDVVLSARTWVVKVGTSVLTDGDGTARPGSNRPPCRADLRGHGDWPESRAGELGAVGAGLGQLNLSRRPENLPQLQAAAAVGQSTSSVLMMRASDVMGGTRLSSC